jgi:hypothetical protein
MLVELGSVQASTKYPKNIFFENISNILFPSQIIGITLFLDKGASWRTPGLVKLLLPVPCPHGQ